jgi:hypothetical protein
MFKIEAKVGQKYDLWAEKLKTNNAMVRMEVKRISNKHGHLFFAITSTEKCADANTCECDRQRSK